MLFPQLIGTSSAQEGDLPKTALYGLLNVKISSSSFHIKGVQRGNKVGYH